MRRADHTPTPAPMSLCGGLLAAHEENDEGRDNQDRDEEPGAVEQRNHLMQVISQTIPQCDQPVADDRRTGRRVEQKRGPGHVGETRRERRDAANDRNEAREEDRLRAEALVEGVNSIHLMLAKMDEAAEAMDERGPAVLPNREENRSADQLTDHGNENRKPETRKMTGRDEDPDPRQNDLDANGHGEIAGDHHEEQPGVTGPLDEVKNEMMESFHV